MLSPVFAGASAKAARKRSRMRAFRFAAVGICALIPLLAQAAQLRVPTVKPPARDQPILLQADEIVYDSENHLVSAVGHVEIADQDRTLNAARVDYDQDTDKVTASGHVSIMDTKGNVVFADHVVLPARMRNGALSGFGALRGKTGRMAARSVERVNGTTVIAHRTVYSPCTICQKQGQRTPLWQVKAEREVYDQTTHKVRFRYAIGLLTPEVGNSSKIGYFTRLPVYFSLSSCQDMTVAPMFSTSGGEVLEMEYRQRWNNGGFWLQGSGAYNPAGGLAGSPGPQPYGHIFGSGRQQLGEAWRGGIAVEDTSHSA